MEQNTRQPITEVVETQPDSPENFANILQQRNIPCDSQRAILVAESFLKRNPPAGFLTRLANSLRYIDQREFNEDLRKLATHITDSYKDSPYELCSLGEHNSQLWIYNLLQQFGIPQPVSMISNAMTMDSSWKPMTENILIVEDWCFTAAQLLNEELPLVVRNMKDHNISPHIEIGLLYTTQYAKDLLSEEQLDLYVASPNEIEMLSDTLRKEDRLLVHKLTIEEGYFETGESGTLGWWKRPDNFPDLLIKPGEFQLFQEADFVPPYKLQ